MGLSKTITLGIESRLENVSLVGATINKICSLIPLSKVESYQLELCVVEGVNNAIEHAYKMRPGNKVEITIRQDLDKILFSISDQGEEMRQTPNRTKLDFDPEDLEQVPEGGMGLFIINSVMDKVTYSRENDVNTLTLMKKFETVVPQAAASNITTSAVVQ